MPKPYIQKIKPFDADKDYEISLDREPLSFQQNHHPGL